MKTVSQHLAKTLVALSLTVPVAAVSLGCEKNEPPPPLPEAKPAPTPTAVKLEIEEDAGEEPEEEKKKTGKGFKRKSPLSACCQALSQNAANAPPQTKAHLQTAAAACRAAAASGVTAPFLRGLSGMLKGAGAPAACR